MTLPLRSRIFLTLVPLLVLLIGLGCAGIAMLADLGGRIDLILRENYASIIAMERLNESVERIDSSFQFALVGEEHKAREDFEANWKEYDKALRIEENNITVEGEAKLVAQLKQLTEQYRHNGAAFYAALHLRNEPRPYLGSLSLLPGPAQAVGVAGVEAIDLHRAYFGSGGLNDLFNRIKTVEGRIVSINQEDMQKANRNARETASTYLVGFTFGLALASVLALLAAWHTVRTILRPIQAVTEAAEGIRTGNLDQLVSYRAPDELGQLAEGFNLMARYLRDFRQSHSAQLLRAQRTGQATINSFPDPVLVVDTEGTVEMANPAAQRLLGVLPRQPNRPAPAPWLPPEPLRDPVTAALQGQSDYLPEGFDRAVALGCDGREASYLPRILTIHDPYGNALGAAVLLQDVTRFHLLDQFKTDLVATVSHELKTPLTSLRLDLHLILEETLGPLAPKQLELLLDARENAERLLAIVNNLLDLARLQQKHGQMELRSESPADLLQAAVDVVRPRADDKGIELRVDAPPDLPQVAADAPRLRHALNNLLDNAITWTDRGGRITLSAEQAGDVVVLSVVDTGHGIPAEHLPHVFERFFRVPGQSRGSGTGLGLAIVARDRQRSRRDRHLLKRVRSRHHISHHAPGGEIALVLVEEGMRPWVCG